MELQLQERLLIADLSDPQSKGKAFAQVLQLYQKKIYNIVRKMVVSHDDADDIVQDVFVKVWNSLDQFKGDSQIFTWIYRIAVNESLTFLRRRKRFRLFSKDDNSDLENRLTAELADSADEIQVKLQRAILKLPDKQRLVFNMKYFEDLSYEQIAQITETSVGSLKASYHHAVSKIEEYLKS